MTSHNQLHFDDLGGKDQARARYQATHGFQDHGSRQAAKGSLRVSGYPPVSNRRPPASPERLANLAEDDSTADDQTQIEFDKFIGEVLAGPDEVIGELSDELSDESRQDLAQRTLDRLNRGKISKEQAWKEYVAGLSDETLADIQGKEYLDYFRYTSRNATKKTLDHNPLKDDYDYEDGVSIRAWK